MVNDLDGNAHLALLLKNLGYRKEKYVAKEIFEDMIKYGKAEYLYEDPCPKMGWVKLGIVKQIAKHHGVEVD